MDEKLPHHSTRYFCNLIRSFAKKVPSICRWGLFMNSFPTLQKKITTTPYFVVVLTNNYAICFNLILLIVFISLTCSFPEIFYLSRIEPWMDRSNLAQEASFIKKQGRHRWIERHFKIVTVVPLQSMTPIAHDISCAFSVLTLYGEDIWDRLQTLDVLKTIKCTFQLFHVSKSQK